MASETCAYCGQDPTLTQHCTAHLQAFVLGDVAPDPEDVFTLYPNPEIHEPTFTINARRAFGFCLGCGDELTFSPRGAFVAFCRRNLAFKLPEELAYAYVKPRAQQAAQTEG